MSWITNTEASGQNPYELAAYWGDRSRWPLPGQRNAADELHELATMSTLADWLTRWIPIYVHAALLAGASVPAVAAAAGVAPHDVRTLWTPWVTGQVHLWECSNPQRRVGIGPDEADRVRGVLDEFDGGGQDG